jgi:uncharacterized protein (TIGR02147 family)
MQQIFEYTNYRVFLRDIFEESKRKNPAFTHRYLADKLGLLTPNLILLIMQGKRSLTLDMSRRLAEWLKLTVRQRHYFEAMVAFLNAKKHEDKNEAFSRMSKFRHVLKIKNIVDQHYEYYSNWYNPVIRELVTYPDFKGDYKSLGKRVSPPVSEYEARQAVKLLLKLGMIKKKGGRYIQTETLITTGPEVKSIAVVNYHRTMARLAESSYDRCKGDEHNITAVTLSMTKENLFQLERETTDYRRRLIAFAQVGSKKTKVYQVNIQIFPVSRMPKKRKMRK